MPGIPPAVTDLSRLAAVRETGLAGRGPLAALDRLAGLAAAVLETRWAVLTVVDDARSWWAGSAGVDPGFRRSMPVGDSLSRHVIEAGAAVAVADVGAEPQRAGGPSLAGMGIVAWAGVPLPDPAGEVLGALWVAESRPRAWTDREVGVLAELADNARTEITLRMALERSRAAVDALERLARTSAALIRALSFDEIADVALREAIETLGARAASVALTDADGERFVAVRTTGFPDEARRRVERMEVGDSVLSAEAVRTLTAVWAHGEGWTRRFPDSASIADHLGTEAAALPLIAAGGLVGVLGLVFDDARRRTPYERTFAASLADQCAQAMERGRLFDLERRTAEAVQRSLLPRRLPDVPGVQVAARYLPSSAGGRVGGDFYDLFRSADGAWGAVVGDVCGKGPEAAAITAQARHVIRAHARAGEGPAAVLRHLNANLMEDERSFLTAAHLRFRADGGAVEGELCLGGHPPPYVVRAGGAVEQIGLPGALIGVLPDPRLRPVPFALASGDAIVLYTDGVTEARRDGRLFGADGLGRTLDGCRAASADGIADAVLRDVRAHARPEDDVALLVLRPVPSG